MVLDEGRNREIRRLLARIGHKVQRLTRIAVGPVRLGDLPSGAVRLLTKQEISALRQAIATGPRKKTAPKPAPQPASTPSAKPSDQEGDEITAKRAIIGGEGSGETIHQSAGDFVNDRLPTICDEPAPRGLLRRRRDPGPRADSSRTSGWPATRIACASRVPRSRGESCRASS